MAEALNLSASKQVSRFEMFISCRSSLNVLFGICQQSYQARHFSVLALLVQMQHLRLDYVLLFNRLDTVPSTTQSLLPQADAVIASADSEHVAAQAPAYAPRGGVNVEDGRFPFV